MMGTQEVVRAEADGHTVGMISSTHAIKPYLYQQMPYDVMRDITSITNLVITPLIVIVPANSPYKTLVDLVADVKTNPNEINYFGWRRELFIFGNGVI